MSDSRVAIAYIPVIHRGYLNYLNALAEEKVTDLYLVSDEILASHEELDYIHRKDRLRAVSHEDMKKALSAITPLRIHSLDLKTIFDLHEMRALIHSPREDINRFIIETYFSGHQIQFHDVFLRRNQENTDSEKVAEGGSTESLSEFEKSTLGAAVLEAQKSADWWRQVGAAIAKDEVLIAVGHNEHMPEKELPNIIGDSRSLFKKGINVDYVTSVHAEAAVIGEAARRGISTEGAELFVTDFPCPYCARLIAKSGIKKIYFMQGYAVLGGEEFFKDMNIETVKVDSAK
jgi:dCMP deaminase